MFRRLFPFAIIHPGHYGGGGGLYGKRKKCKDRNRNRICDELEIGGPGPQPVEVDDGTDNLEDDPGGDDDYDGSEQLPQVN